MKRILLALAILAALTTTATAQPTVITTGAAGGTYIRVGQNLAKFLPSTVVLESAGGVQNLDRLASGEAQIALAQSDTLADFIAKSPDKAANFMFLGALYEECAFIAVNAKGTVQDEDDLQKAGPTVGVGKPGSGGASTWDYMRRLEPGYAKSAISPEGGLLAMGKLAAMGSGKNAPLNAVLFVTKPDPNSKLIATVVNNPNLKFIDVDDSDLNDKLPMTGEPVYRFQTVATKAGGVFGSKGKVDTICMDSVMVADGTMDQSVLEKVADLVLNYKNSLVK